MPQKPQHRATGPCSQEPPLGWQACMKGTLLSWMLFMVGAASHCLLLCKAVTMARYAPTVPYCLMLASNRHPEAAKLVQYIAVSRITSKRLMFALCRMLFCRNRRTSSLAQQPSNGASQSKLSFSNTATQPTCITCIVGPIFLRRAAGFVLSTGILTHTHTDSARSPLSSY